MSTPIKNQLCECCAIWITNADDSGCRDYHGHDHPYARSEVAGVASDIGPETRWDTWTCDGCDTEQKPGAKAWTYHRL